MRQLAAIFLSIALCLPGAVAYATEYSSSNFKVSNPVIEELGGLSSSANFKLWSNIPYIEPRLASSTNYKSIPGFLGYPGSSTATTTGGGGGGGGGGGSTHDGAFGGGYNSGPQKPKPLVTEEIRNRVDFNHDGKVDFIDFSILLYYFDKRGSIIVPFDLNDDTYVDMVDISIFMYYWDGN
jgi:hypothetical protein